MLLPRRFAILRRRFHERRRLLDQAGVAQGHRGPVVGTQREPDVGSPEPVVRDAHPVRTGGRERRPDAVALEACLRHLPDLAGLTEAPAGGHLERPPGQAAIRHDGFERWWHRQRDASWPAGQGATSPYQRVRARRGHQVAIVAAARKLACLFWCLLTRGEDYAYAQPSLTKKKLRRLELTAGAPKARGKTNIWSTNDAMRQAERALAEQAEQAYERTVADWQAAAPAKVGASATPGRASQQPSRSQAARQTTRP